MQNAVQKLKKFLNKIRFFFPSSLPVGMTEFYVWADSIIDAYGLPNNDSSQFALATMILHLDSTSDSKPKRYFGKAALKSMSNQIAAGVMQDLKQKQVEKAKQEQEKALTVEEQK